LMRDAGATAAAIALGRRLARRGRVVLVDLATGSPHLSAISSDPEAPGIAELIRGSASFGDIITRDRHSRVHLVMAGNQADGQPILDTPRLAITLEALAQSYDYLIIDASSLPQIAAEQFAQVAPRAVLVGSETDDPLTIRAREELLHAGFAHVSTLASTAEDDSAQGAQAAA